MLRLFRRAAPVQVQRTTATFTLGDGREIEVRFTPHPRARRLRITIGDGGVRVTVPPRVADRTVDQFIHAHLDWIATHLDRRAHSRVPPLQLFTPGHVLLRGEPLEITWHTGKTDRVWRTDTGVQVQVRQSWKDSVASPALKRAFRDFYVAEARADVARWLPGLCTALGRAPTRLHHKCMRTQWGSMSSRGVMALELSLVLGSAEAFRYVLVHELCHLQHPDHSQAFWRAVEKFTPAWRTERDYLNAEGGRLKSALAALID